MVNLRFQIEMRSDVDQASSSRWRSFLVRQRSAVTDCLFLLSVVILSLFLYVGHLGFYSDDWDYLGGMQNASSASLAGYFRAIYTPTQYYRPVEILYWAILFRFFGLNPLGSHLVNSAVLAITIVLFYLTLRELRLPRYFTLGVPLIFALLPNYSTERFWFSAYENTISITLYFLSLYSDLRALRAHAITRGLWKALSIVSLLLSLLSYEVPLPFFMANIFLVWSQARRLYGLNAGFGRISMGSNLVAISSVFIAKALTAQRTGSNFLIHSAFILKQVLNPNYGPYGYGLNIQQAVLVNFGYYGFGLPYVVWRMMRDDPNTRIMLMTILTGLLIFVYLFFVLRHTKTEFLDRNVCSLITLTGLIVFALGYSIFLINSNVQFTPTGIGNRTAIGASIGVAITFIGALGWVSTLVSSTRRKQLFCFFTALLCACGFLINNALASFWMTAYVKEKTILANIHQRFPSVPSGTTILLDGVCPYEGPAIIFESPWDLKGALRIIYRDPTLRGDVVTPRLMIEKEGLSTTLYARSFYSLYPYGAKLWIYNDHYKVAAQITDIQAARKYFRLYNRDFGKACPEGHEGHGVPVL